MKLLLSSENTADGFLGDYLITLYDNPSPPLLVSPISIVNSLNPFSNEFFVRSSYLSLYSPTHSSSSLPSIRSQPSFHSIPFVQFTPLPYSFQSFCSSGLLLCSITPLQSFSSSGLSCLFGFHLLFDLCSLTWFGRI